MVRQYRYKILDYIFRLLMAVFFVLMISCGMSMEALGIVRAILAMLICAAETAAMYRISTYFEWRYEYERVCKMLPNAGKVFWTRDKYGNLRKVRVPRYLNDINDPDVQRMIGVYCKINGIKLTAYGPALNEKQRDDFDFWCSLHIGSVDELCREHGIVLQAGRPIIMKKEAN